MDFQALVLFDTAAEHIGNNGLHGGRDRYLLGSLLVDLFRIINLGVARNPEARLGRRLIWTVDGRGGGPEGPTGQTSKELSDGRRTLAKSRNLEWWPIIRCSRFS